jgi:hypothetical protein
MTGKQVKVFLVDGTPGGLTTAEITNWTGKIVAGPRSELAELLKREEANRTGAYLLVGEDPEALGGVRCYLGEADVIASRLKKHAGANGQDFWSRAVLITSKDENLTKAHARYLEARLIAMAKAAGRSTVENSTAPVPPPLPEADVSDMDYFVTQLQIVLPVLGINLLRSRATIVSVSPPTAPAERSTSPIFRLSVPKAGIEATAQEVDGEFTVLAGSSVAAEVRASESYAASTAAAYAAYEALHKKLRDDGSIDTTHTPAVLTRDVVFSSPSTAGAIVTGRSCNGRQSWISDDGTTYGGWQGRGVAEDG